MKRLLCTFVFIFWRQIYKLYQSSDYNAESKFPLFMDLAFIEKLKFLSSQKINFPAKKLRKNTHAPICYLKLCKLHPFKMIQFSRQKNTGAQNTHAPFFFFGRCE